MSWAGKILRVNLTAGTVKSEPLNMEWAKAYLGSRGLIAQLVGPLFHFVDAGPVGIDEGDGPVGQASAQAGSPPHRSHFCTLPVSCT